MLRSKRIPSFWNDKIKKQPFRSHTDKWKTNIKNINWIISVGYFTSLLVVELTAQSKQCSDTYTSCMRWNQDEPSVCTSMLPLPKFYRYFPNIRGLLSMYEPKGTFRRVMRSCYVAVFQLAVSIFPTIFVFCIKNFQTSNNSERLHSPTHVTPTTPSHTIPRSIVTEPQSPSILRSTLRTYSN